jgi:O-antigen/teichoic acid export membrane protein
MQKLQKLFFCVKQNHFAYSTFVVLVGSTFANFGNWLFHLLMGRLLVPSDYGVLIALISFLTLLSVPSGPLNLLTVKITSEFAAKREFGKVTSFFNFLTWRIFIFGLTLFLVLAALSLQLSQFLKLPSASYLLLLAIVPGVLLLTMINRSLIQGLLKFELFALTGIFEVFLKIIFAVILIQVGFGVSGIIAAMIFAELLVWVMTFFPLKLFWLPASNQRFEKIKLFTFSLPVVVASLSLLSFFSSDIILVKHFFSPHDAGIYSSLSVIGRVVLFASLAIGAVMFPMIAQKFTARKAYLGLFYSSLAITLILSGLVVLFYNLFPKFVVGLFFGRSYFEVLPYLSLFSIFMLILALVSIMVSFFLAIESKAVFFVPLAALLQIILIFLFHTSLFQIILSSILATILLFGFLVIYFFKNVAFSYRSSLPAGKNNP